MSVQRREKQHGRSGSKPYSRPAGSARAAPPAAQPSLLGTLYGIATAPVRWGVSLFTTAEEPEEEYDAASGALQSSPALCNPPCWPSEGRATPCNQPCRRGAWLLSLAHTLARRRVTRERIVPG